MFAIQAPDKCNSLQLTGPEQRQYVKCPISQLIWSVWVIGNWRGVFWQTLVRAMDPAIIVRTLLKLDQP